MNFETATFASVLDPSRVFQGLTAKQEAYAQARFAGMGPSEAYKEAFGAETSKPESIARMAYDVDRNVNVVARVHQLTAERNSHSSLMPFLSRDFVLNGVMRLAMMGTKETVQLQAYALLGKTVGIDLFRETTRVEKVTRTPEDVDRELKDSLQNMMRTIEGSSAPVEPGSVKVEPATDKPKDRRRKPQPK